MIDRPILFSGPMVKAHLAGLKTQTRRIPTPTWRKVVPGDRLWVRERTLCLVARDGEIKVRYEADGHEPDIWIPFPDRLKFKPEPGKRLSMGCYREASRITDVVTAVKTERLKEISEEDAKAEGCRSFGPLPGGDHDVPTGGAADAFKELWNSLHGAGSWEKNPELIALTFTVHKINIDQMAKEMRETGTA